MTVKILSIDGGGVRGIIPAVILDYMENSTGKPTSDLFDFIAGTSTGGIIALGVTAPDQNGKPKFQASELLKLYLEEAGEIFHRGWWYEAKSLGGARLPKYPVKGLNRKLKEYFGDIKLSQALKPVYVTSFDVKNWKEWVFSSDESKMDASTDCFVRDAARATSAAPTYFEPFEWKNKVLIDGGMHLNNPTLVALIEARKKYPHENQFLVVSIGTGKTCHSIEYKKAKNWGLPGWAKWVLEISLSTNDIDYYMKNVVKFQSVDVDYHRLQIDLQGKNESMDNSDPENLKALKIKASKYILQNQSSLDSLLDKVAL